MKWLLVLTSFSGDVQMMHVTKEQCLAAISFYKSDAAPRLTADCFPPDAVFRVEGMSGGKAPSHHSFSARENLPQVAPPK